MQVKVINEAGYNEALLGLSLSHKQEPDRMPLVAMRLCSKDYGHNKFMESIVVWLDIAAPRYWWQQFDTYRVGMTKQSESTMHTLTKRSLTQDDFEGGLLPAYLDHLNGLIADGDLTALKQQLPESFLQRRIVCTNYKTLRNMIIQRHAHRLPEWHTFIGALLAELKYTELLPQVTITYIVGS